MKRNLITLLLCACLLAGCAQNQAPETTAPETTLAPTEESVPETTESRTEDLSVKDSEVEAFTHGAVKAYHSAEDNMLAVLPMGEQLLVLTGGDQSRLILLDGRELTPNVSKNLNCVLESPEISLHVTEDGVVYYDPAASCIMALDKNLEEQASISMPADMAGIPVLSPDRTKVYYTVNADVQVLNLNTGISRLLKKTDLTSVQLQGICGNGSMLELKGTGADGKEIVTLLDSENGETLHVLNAEENFVISNDRIYIQRYEGSVNQLLFGGFEENLKCLTPKEAWYEAAAVPTANGWMTIAQDQGVLLSFYDLETGYRTSNVVLPEGMEPVDFAVDQNTGRMYFKDAANPQYFYSWDMAMSPSRELKNYVDLHYTQENPDAEALENCKSWAERLSEKYHVNLKIWNDAILWDGAEPEYQIAAYRRDLKVLDDAMASLSEGFLEALASGTDSKELNISLVRSQNASEPEGQVLNWEDGDAFLTLTMGRDLRRQFYHGISHMIDNRVFGTSVLFDNWEDLNPEGFAYDNDYEVNKDRDGSEYLQEDTRAFVDTYSMSFPTEDRARIFETAMEKGNEAFFTSEIMQNKLTRLCEGIREAFGMEDVLRVLPWETYLEEPLFEIEENA